MLQLIANLENEIDYLKGGTYGGGSVSSSVSLQY